MNVRPAIVSVPDLALVVVLVPTLYVTLPDPVPLAPAVIVVHVAVPTVAVHAHVGADAVTVTLPAPPAAAGDADVGEIENEQLGVLPETGYSVSTPARSSGPSAGGTGIVDGQHDEFMMFDEGLTLLCPRPIV